MKKTIQELAADFRSIALSASRILNALGDDCHPQAVALVRIQELADRDAQMLEEALTPIQAFHLAHGDSVRRPAV